MLTGSGEVLSSAREPALSKWLLSATPALAEGRGAAVSFARHYIGNPDLVHRLREGLPLAAFDPKSLYTPGQAGYTDYPRADTATAPS